METTLNEGRWGRARPRSLEPHDELLARPHTNVLPARGEVGLRRGHESVALRLDLAPVGVGKEIAERPDGEAALPDIRQDPLLELVEVRRRLGEASRAERFERRRSWSS